MASILNRIEELDDEDEEPEKDYEDNWIIAWVYNGEYWSNPYCKEDGFLDDYFEDMDDDFSIHSEAEVDEAQLKALLFENNNNKYTLVISGQGEINIYLDERHWDDDKFAPWLGHYWTLQERNTCDGNFTDNYLNNISRLEIREGITSIEYNSFRWMNFNYVYIPGSVESIKADAFCSTYELEEVEFSPSFNGQFETDQRGYSYSFYDSNWLNYQESIVDEAPRSISLWS